MKVACATIEITPPYPVALAGCYGRFQPFRNVHDPLEANALLIILGDRRLFLLSLDVLYCGPVVTRFLNELLAARGISSSDVFLTASHTHFAPATDPELERLGPLEGGYLNYLRGRIAALVDSVLAVRPINAFLEHRKTHLPFCINRRRHWNLPTVNRRGLSLHGGIVNAPNRSGRQDESGDLLVARAVDGRPLALIWRYACHPVSLPHKLSVSAEYPGVVREAVRRECGEALPVLFWQGFAGDIRPKLGTNPTLKHLPAIILRGPRFVRVSAEDWHAWAQGVGERVVAALRSREARTALDGDLTTDSHSIPVSQFISGSSTSKLFRIQRLSFGSSLTILFASAEVVAEHVDQLATLGRDVIGVGYAGDVFGYLPTDEQVRQGGYEARGWFDLFGIGSGFTRSLDALWAESVAAVTPR